MSEGFSLPAGSEEYAVLIDGEYGIKEEAILHECAIKESDGESITLPWDKAKVGMRFGVTVKHPQFGHVRMRTILERPTGPNDKVGPQLNNWLKQLGIKDTSKTFNPKDLVGTKVVVKVKLRKYIDDSGTERQINNILQLAKRG